MSKLRVSRLAEADFYDIGLYTLRTWGESQTDRYINEIDDCCRLLADNPGLARSCDEIRPGLRLLEHGKHVVFYRAEVEGLVICRILHQRMLPERQDFDTDD